jgi:hypothetical protein
MAGDVVGVGDEGFSFVFGPLQAANARKYISWVWARIPHGYLGIKLNKPVLYEHVLLLKHPRESSLI